MKLFTTNNKVNFKFIESELEKVVFKVVHLAGTNTTVATAFDKDGFQLGVGTSGCVDSNNFNADIGKGIAIDNAKAQAKEKLWELYGFLLHKKLMGDKL